MGSLGHSDGSSFCKRQWRGVRVRRTGDTGKAVSAAPVGDLIRGDQELGVGWGRPGPECSRLWGRLVDHGGLAWPAVQAVA